MQYTITGFKKHCINMRYESYEYISEEQNQASDNLRVVFTANLLETSLAPHRIYLCSNAGFIVFQKVKYIVHVCKNDDGDTYDIVCDDMMNENEENNDAVFRIYAKM